MTDPYFGHCYDMKKNSNSGVDKTMKSQIRDQKKRYLQRSQ